jgi:hypothetical protein
MWVRGRVVGQNAVVKPAQALRGCNPAGLRQSRGLCRSGAQQVIGAGFQSRSGHGPRFIVPDAPSTDTFPGAAAEVRSTRSSALRERATPAAWQRSVSSYFPSVISLFDARPIPPKGKRRGQWQIRRDGPRSAHCLISQRHSSSCLDDPRTSRCTHQICVCGGIMGTTVGLR